MPSICIYSHFKYDKMVNYNSQTSRDFCLNRLKLWIKKKGKRRRKEEEDRRMRKEEEGGYFYYYYCLGWDHIRKESYTVCIWLNNCKKVFRHKLQLCHRLQLTKHNQLVIMFGMFSVICIFFVRQNSVLSKNRQNVVTS